MKMNKRFLLVDTVIFAILTIFFTSCGSGSSPSTFAPPPTAQSTSTPLPERDTSSHVSIQIDNIRILNDTTDIDGEAEVQVFTIVETEDLFTQNYYYPQEDDFFRLRIDEDLPRGIIAQKFDSFDIEYTDFVEYTIIIIDNDEIPGKEYLGPAAEFLFGYFISQNSDLISDVLDDTVNFITKRSGRDRIEISEQTKDLIEEIAKEVLPGKASAFIDWLQEQDELASFSLRLDRQNNWGLGSHTEIVGEGNVEIQFTVYATSPTLEVSNTLNTEDQQLVRDFIILANKAQILAESLQDMSYANELYAGSFLREIENNIEGYEENGVFKISEYNEFLSYYPNMRFISDEILTVDGCEYWRTTFFAEEDGNILLEEGDWRLVPQTITIEIVGDLPRITAVSFYEGDAFCTR